MKGQYSSKDRNKLKQKMATILGEEIQMLSPRLQEIFLDDFVTAFANRLKVLNNAQPNLKFEMAESVEYETVQT